ncbi:MAG TPA: BBP7 family outer membrane beta-barrel protein [Gemmata sp.]|nr:BBP7 family outer membrane beta-barrel protein [Gemmata sp.]
MASRWLLALGLALLGPLAAPAQVASDPLERPTQLPPLLIPPTAQTDQRPPAGPRGPAGEYDHGHLYLPHYEPPAPAVAEVCRPLGRWWVNPTVELAWVPSRPAPGAVRLKLPAGLDRAYPGPVVPVGGRTTDDFQGGFGLSVGRFFGETNTHAVEGSLYLLGVQDYVFPAYAPGMLVVFPGGASNSAPQFIPLPSPLASRIVGVFPATLSSFFIGADANYRRNLYCSAGTRLDAVAGYRFAYLGEELFLGDVPDPDSDAYTHNRVLASNAFHGGQVGLAGEWRADAWYVGGAAKVAFGAVVPHVCASGAFVGAQGSASGGYSRLSRLADPPGSQFAVLPTVNVAVGRQLTDHARLFAGYSFQYLSRVTRLGDVLAPAGTGTTFTDFWVQAVNFGMELRY